MFCSSKISNTYFLKHGPVPALVHNIGINTPKKMRVHRMVILTWTTCNIWLTSGITNVVVIQGKNE